MGRQGRRLRTLANAVAQAYPDIEDANALIARGGVLVDGICVRNPSTLVRAGASIAIRADERLRGERKLEAALAAFDVRVQGRVALDVGAAAGGFTRALLRAGARRVYAVDAGHGQLLGSLRQDPRVVNLERTNLGELERTTVPDTIEIVTIDVSYLALARAAAQLDRVRLAARADAIALVKPQFELGLASPPEDEAQLEEAHRLAAAGFRRSGWSVRRTIESPVRGACGAVEFFLHATRRSYGTGPERPRQGSDPCHV